MSQDRKELTLINSPDEFKPGDILFFNFGRNVPLPIKIIQYAQALLDRQHGHFDCTHVGVVVGDQKYANDKTKFKAISFAQVNNAGYSVKPLKEPTDNINEWKMFQQPLLVYRPINSDVGQAIADTIINQGKVKPKFGIASSVLSEFSPFKQNEQEVNQVSEAIVCSQFVAQTIKLANKNHKEYLPDAPTACLPKTLESALYKNRNYQLLTYTGDANPYLVIKKEIEDQIKRLEKKSDQLSQDKAENLRNKLNEQEISLNSNQDINNMQKTIILLRELSPLLAINTGLGLRKSTAFTEVMQTARSMNIYERDIRSPYEQLKLDIMELKKELNSPKLTDATKQEKIKNLEDKIKNFNNQNLIQLFKLVTNKYKNKENKNFKF